MYSMSAPATPPSGSPPLEAPFRPKDAQILQVTSTTQNVDTSLILSTFRVTIEAVSICRDDHKCRQVLASADIYGYNPDVSNETAPAERPQIFRLQDLDRVGLTRGRLRSLVSAGKAEKIARGLYRWKAEATELETVATVAAQVPDAIVCLLTALLVHDIGTQLPHEIWIAIDRKARKPRIDYVGVRIIRYSGEMQHYGVETRLIQGVPVHITSPARTVIDCFRYRNKIGIDVALEALKDAIATRRVSIQSLVRTAQACRCEAALMPYLEAIAA